MRHEGISGGNCVFLCLREEYISLFPVYQDLERDLQTLKIPGKFLECCPDQRGKTLAMNIFLLAANRVVGVVAVLGDSGV